MNVFLNKIIKIFSVSLLILLSFFSYGKTNLTLEKINQKIIDERQIENLFGTYVHYHVANLYEDPRYANLFSRHSDTRVQTSRGMWVGSKAAERMLGYYAQMSGGEGYAGHLHLHPITTPIIEVAGDGKTAKGMWISPGVEVSPRDGVASGMELTVRYAVDFRKDDGEWKIWHLRINAVYAHLFGEKFVGFPPRNPKEGEDKIKPRPEFIPNPVTLKPDMPAVGAGIYDVNTVQLLDPLPPVPYESWDDSMTYMPDTDK